MGLHPWSLYRWVGRLLCSGDCLSVPAAQGMGYHSRAMHSPKAVLGLYARNVHRHGPGPDPTPGVYRVGPSGATTSESHHHRVLR